MFFPSCSLDLRPWDESQELSDVFWIQAHGDPSTWKYSGFFRILVSIARDLAAIPVEIGVDCSENKQDRSAIQDQRGKPTAK
jgi:hypothetical protein